MKRVQKHKHVLTSPISYVRGMEKKFPWDRFNPETLPFAKLLIAVAHDTHFIERTREDMFRAQVMGAVAKSRAASLKRTIEVLERHRNRCADRFTKLCGASRSDGKRMRALLGAA